MQEKVAAKFAPHVVHVRLTNILSNAPGKYLDHWENELHPNVPGFTLLTQKFAQDIANSRVLRDRAAATSSPVAT
jgi:hypothetical protein